MSRTRIWMPERFLWFLVMVVTSANSQSANITCKITTTGDLCCPDLQQQDGLALGEKTWIVSLRLVNSTTRFDASNETDGAVADVNCLVCVVQSEQPEVDRLENKTKLQGRLRNYELDKRFVQTCEDLNKCSSVVCFVAEFCVILTLRYNNTHCDDHYRFNDHDAQRICEKVCDKSKHDKYMESCVTAIECLRRGWAKIFLDTNNCDIRSNYRTSVFPFTPRALTSKVEDGYFGIPFRQVGGIPGFVILSFIYVTGLVLNCILLRIFIRHEEMRKDSKFIIINIAAADMLNLVLHSPPIDTFLVNSIHSPLSVTYVFYMIVGLSIYSVMMFSCHIYLTVLPVKNRRNSGYNSLRRYSPHAHAFIAVLLACLVPVPLISFIEEYYRVSLYVLIAYCAVPLCCSTLFSVGTSLKLGSCVQSVQCGSSDHEALRGPRSNSANTLVALIVVSAVSYVPYFCLPFIPPYIGEDSEVHPFLIPWVFVWLNSFMNPIALYAANRNFRNYFNKYICFCCCAGKE